MSRLSILNNPLLLGFDQFERTLERVAKASTDGYPPYNIEKMDDGRLRITLAVAGISKDRLEITHEANQLTVSGRNSDEDTNDSLSAGREYLHRGIAARAFQRSFVMAEGIKIDGAWLENGLLHIDLVRPTPPQTVRTIEIKTPADEKSKTRNSKTRQVIDVK